MSRFALLICCLLVTVIIPATAMCTDLHGAFFYIRREAALLLHRDGINQEAVSSILDQISDLQDILQETEVSPAYVRSLGYQALLIRRARGAPPEEAGAILAAVQDDIATKLRFEWAVAEFSAARTRDIEVTVVTRRHDGTPVERMYVYANPVFFRDSDPIYPFTGLSSPTTEVLPPGKYDFTARLRGDVAQRLSVRLGLTGDVEEEVVILVD